MQNEVTEVQVRERPVPQELEPCRSRLPRWPDTDAHAGGGPVAFGTAEPGSGLDPECGTGLAPGVATSPTPVASGNSMVSSRALESVPATCFDATATG